MPKATFNDLKKVWVCRRQLQITRAKDRGTEDPQRREKPKTRKPKTRKPKNKTRDKPRDKNRGRPVHQGAKPGKKK